MDAPGYADAALAETRELLPDARTLEAWLKASSLADAALPSRPRLWPPDEPPLSSKNELQRRERLTVGYGTAAAAAFPATDVAGSATEMPAAASDCSGTACGGADDAAAATATAATAAAKPPPSRRSPPPSTPASWS